VLRVLSFLGVWGHAAFIPQNMMNGRRPGGRLCGGFNYPYHEPEIAQPYFVNGPESGVLKEIPRLAFFALQKSFPRCHFVELRGLPPLYLKRREAACGGKSP